MIPLPTQCCLYEIEEGTKNERVAVGHDGNVLRWGINGNTDQQWVIVPVTESKARLINVYHRNEYMAVGSNGNIRRWPLGGIEQTFDFVNPTPDGWWNIKESTKGEYVAVGSNGNILRWGWTGGNDQRFRLVPVAGPVAPIAAAGEYDPGQLPDVPRVIDISKKPPERSEHYTIGQTIVPASFVEDPLYSDRVAQVSTNPYYSLTRYQLWDRSAERGYYYDHDGKTSRTEKQTLKVGMKHTESVAIERTLGIKVTNTSSMGFKLTGSGKISEIVSLGGELSGSSAISNEISQGLKVTTSNTDEQTHETTEEVSVTLAPGPRLIRVAWSLVDRYVLRRMDGSELASWEVVVPGVRIEDSKQVP